MIENVKTNIITGFLGVGKTTAIIKLLEQRKPGERWSVLVNEFGEMGIDGHLMPGNGKEIAIKQVPGGCVCCAAGLPLQVAVNELLKQTNPDRLIIEPSGMGHPRNILKSLTDKNYEGVLDMRACLCLLDPKKLFDDRYLQSELFIDQIDVADRVVANKTDLCSKEDKQKFITFVNERATDKSTGWIDHGELESVWLDEPHCLTKPSKNSSVVRLGRQLEDSFNKATLDFPVQQLFEYEILLVYINSLVAERVKGIMHTNQGFVVINQAEGLSTIEKIEKGIINRLEIISTEKIDQDEIRQSLNNLSAT